MYSVSCFSNGIRNGIPAERASIAISFFIFSRLNRSAQKTHHKRDVSIFPWRKYNWPSILVKLVILFPFNYIFTNTRKDISKVNKLFIRWNINLSKILTESCFVWILLKLPLFEDDLLNFLTAFLQTFTLIQACHDKTQNAKVTT